jgi:hypothetical protein
MLPRLWRRNFPVNAGPDAANNADMANFPTSAHDQSDFGPTEPGHRSGEGSGSILPYLANSLKVNPNAGALSLARELAQARRHKDKKKPAVPDLSFSQRAVIKTKSK